MGFADCITVYKCVCINGFQFFFYYVSHDCAILTLILFFDFDNFFYCWFASECRQVFQNPTGEIISPNDPDFNTSSAACTYIIRQETSYYIRLQFTSINFEKDKKCRNYIEVNYRCRRTKIQRKTTYHLMPVIARHSIEIFFLCTDTRLI